MHKIPTIFERDWDGDRSLVLELPNPECDWVFAGEGVATRKYDGSCCLFREGVLYKRRDVKPGKQPPPGFELVAVDEQTGRTIGWVPVGDGPDDRWHREALELSPPGEDGSYELIGPKVNGNPERVSAHELVPHHYAERFIVPRSFGGIRDLLAELNVEGFVFYHPDGRMGKIKGRDFGLVRAALHAV